jgi:hypothetical protein
MDLAQMRSTLEDPDLAQYLGQWRRLVSTTNWEKGRIISGWRAAAVARDAPISEFSDEAWARLVGGISPQHVGRLRRVYDRYAGVQSTYVGLYWSHFHAALEWDDGEMWLEGAVQNRWSVSHMRRQRWETLGGHEPVDAELVETEIDEDLEVTQTAQPDNDLIRETTTVVKAAQESSGAFEDSIPVPESGPVEIAAVQEPSRPFADLSVLPLDLEDAMEAFKVAILRHKLGGWREVSAEAVLQSLDALKQLVVSP